MFNCHPDTRTLADTLALDNCQLFNNSVEISLLFCGKCEMNCYKDAKMFLLFRVLGDLLKN